MSKADFEKYLKENKCVVCGGDISRIGAAISGTQLYGCAICHLVYWRFPTESLGDAVEVLGNNVFNKIRNTG